MYGGVRGAEMNYFIFPLLDLLTVHLQYFFKWDITIYIN